MLIGYCAIGYFAIGCSGIAYPAIAHLCIDNHAMAESWPAGEAPDGGECLGGEYIEGPHGFMLDPSYWPSLQGPLCAPARVQVVVGRPLTPTQTEQEFCLEDQYGRPNNMPTGHSDGEVPEPSSLLRQGMCLQQIVRLIWIHGLRVDLVPFWGSFDEGCHCSWCRSRQQKKKNVKVEDPKIDKLDIEDKVQVEDCKVGNVQVEDDKVDNDKMSKAARRKRRKARLEAAGGH